MEYSAERAIRTESNALLKRFQGDNVIVIDIEPLFTEKDGSIRFTGNDGMSLYQDGDHLSSLGADLVKPYVIRAISELNK